MNKPYTRTLKEDFFPYLQNISTVSTKYTYKYMFNINNATPDIRTKFNKFIMQYKCWKYGKNSNIVNYFTDSVTLRDLFYNKEQGTRRRARVNVEVKTEQVEDIPTYISTGFTIDRDSRLDAVSLASTITGRFKQEYPAEFKQKEKEMKFKVKYDIKINVNDKQFTLSDPVKPDAALEVVLELTNRINFLSDQLKTLENINTVADTGTDTIDVSKVTEVLTNEMDEIKEVIDYINSNIED